MANMKNISIKNATFFIFKDNSNTLKNKSGLIVGFRFHDTDEEQFWLSNRYLMNQEFDSTTLEGNKLAYKEIKEMKANGRVNLMDDFDTRQGFEEALGKLTIVKQVSWDNV